MGDFPGIVCMGLWFLINIILLGWAYEDAKKYHQNGYLVGALVLFAGIPGIIVWLLIRDNLPRRM
ncbi:MAG TPA: hypothetical protein PKH77_24485 [Anaerolineae bacterium]|nr:hypothetical protein [Anaerolineae bacterium]